MNWYYAEAGQQKGPVPEAELDALVNSGKVTPDTLVWREGMADWQPHQQARPSSAGTQSANAAVPTAAASLPESPGSVPTGQVVCTECGGVFSEDETIPYGSVSVCANCKPVFFQKLREGAAPAGTWDGTLNYAGFWIRAGAKIIDGIIMAIVMGIPFAILFIAMGAGIENSGEASPAFIGFQILIQVLSVAIAVGYNTFFVGRFAATPGKMACGLRVVMADGGKVSYPRALGRGFADQLSAMICYIGYIIAGFDDEKRALHDHICSTRVIRTR